MILFHVTPTNNINSILENGLLPQIGERSKMAYEDTPAIFCFHDFDQIIDAQWLFGCFDEDASLSLIGVTLSEEQAKTITIDDNLYEVVLPFMIPPGQIEVLCQDLDNLDEWNNLVKSMNTAIPRNKLSF